MREIPLGNFMKSLLLGLVLSFGGGPGLVAFGGWIGHFLLLTGLHIVVLYGVFTFGEWFALQRKRQGKQPSWILEAAAETVAFAAGALLIALFSTAVTSLMTDGRLVMVAFAQALTIFQGSWILGQVVKFVVLCVAAHLYGKFSEGKKYR